MVHGDLSYGTTGIFFGKLDEQHPWLYKTMNLTHNPAAEEYRQRVLRERGWLRGVDYVMMLEIVRAQEALQQTRPTRAVAEEIQLLPAPVAAPTPVVERPRAAEPRLVSVRSRAEAKPKLTHREVDAQPQAARR
jgi:hypothetical protein